MRITGITSNSLALSHNPEVAGSTPVPATKEKGHYSVSFLLWFCGKRQLAAFGYETDERGLLGKHSERIRGMMERGSAFCSGRKNRVSYANEDFFGHRKAARSDKHGDRVLRLIYLFLSVAVLYRISRFSPIFLVD